MICGFFFSFISWPSCCLTCHLCVRHNPSPQLELVLTAAGAAVLPAISVWDMSMSKAGAGANSCCLTCQLPSLCQTCPCPQLELVLTADVLPAISVSDMSMSTAGAGANCCCSWSCSSSRSRRSTRSSPRRYSTWIQGNMIIWNNVGITTGLRSRWDERERRWEFYATQFLFSQPEQRPTKKNC